MSDDKTKTGARIAHASTSTNPTSSPIGRRELGVSEKRLREAVAAAGVMVSAVRAHLRK